MSAEQFDNEDRANQGGEFIQAYLDKTRFATQDRGPVSDFELDNTFEVVGDLLSDIFHWVRRQHGHEVVEAVIQQAVSHYAHEVTDPGCITDGACWLDSPDTSALVERVREWQAWRAGIDTDRLAPSMLRQHDEASVDWWEQITEAAVEVFGDHPDPGPEEKS